MARLPDRGWLKEPVTINVVLHPCPVHFLWPNRSQISIREVKNHVYVKRQKRICTTWPSFLFTCRLTFIISTHKLVVSRNFSSIRIVLSCFYLLSFYFEKFPTWIWSLPFAVYVMLKPSIKKTAWTAGLTLRVIVSVIKKYCEYLCFLSLFFFSFFALVREGGLQGWCDFVPSLAKLWSARFIHIGPSPCMSYGLTSRGFWQ